MFTKEDFLEYYSSLSNSELFLILNNKKDYQPTAIDAANQELINRNLSDEEINDAKNIIKERQTKKEKEKEKITILQSKIKATGDNILETLKPIQPGSPTAEKTINVITIIFGALSVYQIFSDGWYFSDLKYFSNDPLAIFFIFYPLVILPISTLTFLIRKPLGWILLASYLTYNIVWILRVLTRSSIWNSDTEGLINFLPRQSVTSLFIQLLFFGGTLYIISRPSLRELFLITKSKMAVTIGISWFITFILIFFTS